jgi:ParB family chromosome partitioning protein
MTTTAEKVVSEAEKIAPDKRRALGRGLDSLLPGGPRVVVPATPSPAGAAAPAQAGGAPAPHTPGTPDPRDAVVQILLEQIEENPYQTRNHFGPEALEELANSIRSNGVVQPVVVRPAADGR